MPSLRHVDTCFGCSATSPTALGIRVTSSADGAEGRVRFDDGSEGAPGLVHGGLLATLADEVMGYVPHGGNAVRLTTELTIRYRRPTPVDTDLRCVAQTRARAGETDGRRFTVDAVITTADDETTVLAEVDATYVLLVPGSEVT